MRRRNGITGLGVLAAGLWLLPGCVRTIVIPAAPGTPDGIGTPAKPPSTPAQSDTIAQMEEQTRRRINEIRQKHGLKPLKANPALAKVARNYSQQMAKQNFFAHQSPAGESAVDRLRKAGIRYQLMGENLFKGVNISQPVDRAVDGWMKSPGHRENILRPGFSETGIGIWRDGREYHFTQLFMHPL